MLNNTVQKYICGHIHNRWKIYRNIINVSVDAWDYKPVSIKQIEYTFKAVSVKVEYQDTADYLRKILDTV